MKQSTKEWIQYGSALAMLGSAIVLVIANFILEHLIHSSVLAYVGESVAFCAAVYGLALYGRNEIRKAAADIRKELKSEI